MGYFDRLLTLLPKAFREEYGDELRETVRARWIEIERTGGRRARLTFWIREGWAVARLGVRLRVRGLREARWSPEIVRGVGLDLRHALRGALSNPGFTLVTAATLGLGIGATTTIFSAVHAVLLRELPYTEPDRIVTVRQTDRETGRLGQGVSAANLRDLRDRAERLDVTAVAEPWGLDLQLDDRAVNLRTWAVSRGFFEALGTKPVLGRPFTAEEYTEGSDLVVVLGHGSWTNRFGANPAIVGTTLRMEGELYEVVGVLPPTFRFPDEADAWMPRPDKPWDADGRAADFMVGFARLAAGASLEEAQAEADRIARSLSEEWPDVNRDVGLRLVPLREHLFGSVRTPLLILLGAVGFVLLIACANVAGLLLARGRRRIREYAIRGALGAGTVRIVRQISVEGALIAGLGCLFGVGFAFGGLEVIRSLGPDHLPRIDDLRIDGTVLAFALGIAGVSAFLSALVPAFRLARPDLRDTLSEASRGATGGRRAHALRSRLVVTEVALAVVLLIGAGLLLKSFSRLVDHELGFDPGGRFAVQVFAYGYEGTERADFVNRSVEEIRALPGVVDVALTTSVPGATDVTISGIEIDVPYTVVGEAPPPKGQEPTGSVIQVTRGLFDLLDISLVEGREFESSDVDGPPIVVVNESLARRHFPSGGAVGRRLSVLFGDSVPTVREIVGVVADVRPLGHDSEPRPEIYIPLSQVGSGSLTFVVEAERNAAGLINPTREAIWRVNPAQAIWGAATLDELLGEWLKERRFNLYLISGFALVALLLSVVGIFGLVSFSVQQRAGELGVRRALGGGAVTILTMVAREGAALAVTGIAIGVAGALLLTRFLRGMLLDVEPTDPGTFVLLSLVVLGIALLATLVPALRALRIDPVTALREE